MGKTNGSGRKLSIEWTTVNKTENKFQVTCKFCNDTISAKVERIRAHMNKCKKREVTSTSNADHEEETSNELEVLSTQKRKLSIEDSVIPVNKIACNSFSLASGSGSVTPSNPKHQLSMGEFTIKTNDRQKTILDQKISDFFYANNISFNIADSKAFIEMINALRPGYDPPNRKRLAGQLLDEANKSVDLLMEEELKTSTITLMLDGWSNTSADPIIAISIHTGKGIYLLDAIDCGSQKKTAEFCSEVASRFIEEIKVKYNKNVFAVCCDNENKMKKFREIIVKKYPHILALGCSAHYMNLLGKEITPKNVMKYVVEIQKFFRNHHRPLGRLMEKGGQRPQIPNDTRWKSEEACISTFMYNYQKYIEISIELSDEFDKNISLLLDNKGLYRECANLQTQLAVVAKALDRLQKDDCTLSQTVEIWLDVSENSDLSSYEAEIKHRFEQALTPFHYLANMTDPALRGKKLSADQEASAEQWLEILNPDFTISFKMFQIQDTDYYPPTMFSEKVTESFEAKKWWKVMSCKAEKNKLINGDFCKFLEQLHSITSTSASIERIFSSFGLVWSKLRNRLGCDTAKKLVKVYRSLKSSKGIEDEEEEDW